MTTQPPVAVERGLALPWAKTSPVPPDGPTRQLESAVGYGSTAVPAGSPGTVVGGVLPTGAVVLESGYSTPGSSRRRVLAGVVAGVGGRARSSPVRCVAGAAGSADRRRPDRAGHAGRRPEPPAARSRLLGDAGAGGRSCRCCRWCRWVRSGDGTLESVVPPVTGAAWHCSTGRSVTMPETWTRVERRRLVAHAGEVDDDVVALDPDVGFGDAEALELAADQVADESRARSTSARLGGGVDDRHAALEVEPEDRVCCRSPRLRPSRPPTRPTNSRCSDTQRPDVFTSRRLRRLVVVRRSSSASSDVVVVGGRCRPCPGWRPWRRGSARCRRSRARPVVFLDR